MDGVLSTQTFFISIKVRAFFDMIYETNKIGQEGHQKILYNLVNHVQKKAST